MALGALHASMRRVLVGRVLGVHHRVADRAAKLGGLGVVIALVAHHADEDDHDENTRQSAEQPSLLAGVVEIDPWVVLQLRESAVPADELGMLAQKAQDHHRQRRSS